MAKNKKKKSAPAPVTVAWYFMCPSELGVEDIEKAISDSGFETEVWPEAGVLEVVIGEKQSMDVEQCELDLGDEFSNNYVAECKAKAVFYICYTKELQAQCQPLLEKLVSELGGRICADSEDFTPVITA